MTNSWYNNQENKNSYFINSREYKGAFRYESFTNKFQNKDYKIDQFIDFNDFYQPRARNSYRQISYENNIDQNQKNVVKIIKISKNQFLITIDSSNEFDSQFKQIKQRLNFFRNEDNRVNQNRWNNRDKQNWRNRRRLQAVYANEAKNDSKSQKKKSNNEKKLIESKNDDIQNDDYYCDKFDYHIEIKMLFNHINFYECRNCEKEHTFNNKLYMHLKKCFIN